MRENRFHMSCLVSFLRLRYIDVDVDVGDGGFFSRPVLMSPTPNWEWIVLVADVEVLYTFFYGCLAILPEI